MKKKVLAIITSACLATAMLPASALAVDFSDTQNHWAAEAIDRWSDYGVVNGMGGNTFAPGGDRLDEEQLYCLEKFPQQR